MEFHFDLISFLMGSAAAIVALALGHLLGYMAGRIHARLAYRRSDLKPIGFISVDRAARLSGS